MDHTERLQKIRELFVTNGEYEFSNDKDAERFVKKLLWKAESLYSEENFYRDHEDFFDFLCTHHVDSLAYFLYEDKNY